MPIYTFYHIIVRMVLITSHLCACIFQGSKTLSSCHLAFKQAQLLLHTERLKTANFRNNLDTSTCEEFLPHLLSNICNRDRNNGIKIEYCQQSYPSKTLMEKPVQCPYCLSSIHYEALQKVEGRFALISEGHRLNPQPFCLTEDRPADRGKKSHLSLEL